MSRTRASLLLVVTVLTSAAALEITVKSSPEEPAFTVRRSDEQVVLYTIFRGSYAKAGQAIGRLFALAGQKQISPRGPVSYAYLNNPKHVSSEHWLTEIRIPVGKEALKLAGTLGEFTDVKTLPAMELVIAVKPEGLADPTSIYEKLFPWIHQQGYMVADAHSEVFLTGSMSGDYARMRTEILVPVQKASKTRD